MSTILITDALPMRCSATMESPFWMYLACTVPSSRRTEAENFE